MRQLDLFEKAWLDETVPEPTIPAQPRAAAATKPDTGDLQRRLDALLDGRLRSLTLTENRSRIVSARGVKGGLHVRIHRSFVHAPAATLERVAEFLNGARGARRQRALGTIREHFEQHRPEPASAKPRRRSVARPVGRYFDLREIRDELNQRFFDSGVEVEITWGRNAPRRRRRRQGFSIRLGSYHADESLVRVHRALDRGDVPRFVVESVVYHEMLHAAIPPVKGPGGRRRIHPPEFRRRERQFPSHEAAEDWLAENLARLAGMEA